MLEKIIRYFSKKHLFTNFVFLTVFVGGFFAWHNTSKEEMPDITFDTVRISAVYPGASAEDVEYFVTKPIEDSLKSIDGIYQIYSTSSVGSSSVMVEIEEKYSNKEEIFTDIRNAVLDVDLPEEVRDDPRIRLFKTSKKAIIDVAVYFSNEHLLSVDTRRKLQMYAYSLENQLLNLSQVNSISKSGYLQEEIQVVADPKKLIKYDIPFNTVMQEIKSNNIRQPAGTIETALEPKVTLMAELDTVEELEDLVIQGGFEGQQIRLKELANITKSYEKNKSIIKVNGKEAIILNIVKNSSFGILEARDAVLDTVNVFKTTSIQDSLLEVSVLDDESIDVRNRLAIIGINGTIGFMLIVGMLFVFLNKRSGIWVAMGIPFTFCFTMICVRLFGYTINNTTLAAVIIVMGMIVDDAIVVAENITRRFHQGEDHQTAVVKGASFVVLPIIACIATTCVAFVPLFFFSGHGGKFIRNIPPIIFMMLGASLLEAIFILPGHMNLKIPLFEKFATKRNIMKNGNNGYAHWFDRVEDIYAGLLTKILKFKHIIFIVFLCFLISSVFIVTNKMKFVMFPNEETRDIVLTGSISPDSKRYETAMMTKKLEDLLVKYLGKEVVGFRTSIARSRRGGAVEENKFRMIIEIVPKEKRTKSADTLIEEFKSKFEEIEGFEQLNFTKSRWGHSSGVPIEVIVQENNDDIRTKVVSGLVDKMKGFSALKSIEVEEGLRVPEFRIDINREKTKRLSINPKDIASTFRAALEGTVLYDFSDGDEDVDVRFTILDTAKDDIEKVLDLTVENKSDYLVPLRDVVNVEQVISANSISRQKFKRTTVIDADIVKGSKQTPIGIAKYLEKNVFPDLIKKYPSSVISFEGEIKDTRESKGELKTAVIMALLLIFIILSVLFDSLIKPLIIMLAIPFGIVGVVFAFWLHGKTMFGFYAAIGTLGLSGVVVNDAIIMLVKLEKKVVHLGSNYKLNSKIANIAKTRLRAVVLTTLTTVAGVLPTAYGFAGYDPMLAEMMLALAWGLLFATFITLILIPCIYSLEQEIRNKCNV